MPGAEKIRRRVREGRINMDKNLELRKEKNKKEKNEILENREQYRVVISKEANAAIENAVYKVTEGFDAGSITKSDLANFVLLNLPRFFSESDVKALRAQQFDEKRMLGTLLKGENDLPEDLKKAIRSHFGMADKEKKRTARAQSELSTGAPVDNFKLPDFDL